MLHPFRLLFGREPSVKIDVAEFVKERSKYRFQTGSRWHNGYCRSNGASRALPPEPPGAAAAAWMAAEAERELASRALLVAQHLAWVEAGGAARGEERGGSADGGEEHGGGRKGERVGGVGGGEEGVDRAGGGGGRNAAAAPRAARSTAVAAKVNGSAGWMPKRTDSTARAPASAAGRPSAKPRATKMSESRRIIHTT